MTTEQLIELAFAEAALESGLPAAWVQANSRLLAFVRAQKTDHRAKPPPWTEAEDDYLRQSLGWHSEAEIGRRLGRSATAVRVHWKRELKLPAPSRHPDWITAGHIAQTLGVDAAAPTHWMARGILPGRRLPLDRMIRVTRRTTFLRWTVNPRHWMLFRPDGVTDSHLRRLIQLKQQRWPDRWLTTSQAARLRPGLHYRDITRYIHQGRLPGAVKWGNWHVLQSEVLALDCHKGRRRGSEVLWSEAADAFLILARAVGAPSSGIAAMNGWPVQRVRRRRVVLRREGRIPGLIRRHALAVRYDSRSGRMLADWKVHADRLPRIADAMRRFGAGHPPNSPVGLAYVRGVLTAWADWHARGARQRRFVRRLACMGNASPETLLRRYHELQAWGIDPIANRLD